MSVLPASPLHKSLIAGLPHITKEVAKRARDALRGGLMEGARRSTRRQRGPKIRPELAPPVTPEVRELLRVVGEQPAYAVVHWLSAYVDEQFDRELDLLASHVMSAEFDANTVEVAAAMARGRYGEAMDLLVSRMRRRFAKMLRDHQRSALEDEEPEIHLCTACHAAMVTSRRR